MPSAALDVLIQRLRDVPVDQPGKDYTGPCRCEVCRMRLDAADTLAAQAATLGEKDCQIGALKQVVAEVTAERDAEYRIVEMAGEVCHALGINAPGEDAVANWPDVLRAIRERVPASASSNVPVRPSEPEPAVPQATAPAWPESPS